jgi:hypothetical protein
VGADADTEDGGLAGPVGGLGTLEHLLTAMAEELVVAVLESSGGLERAALMVDLDLEVVVQEGVGVEGGITMGDGGQGEGRIPRHHCWRCRGRGLHEQLRADAAEAPDGLGDVTRPQMLHLGLESLHPPVEEARGTSPSKAHAQVDHDIVTPPIREEGGKPRIEEELTEGILHIHLGEDDVSSGIPQAQREDAEEEAVEDLPDVAVGNGRRVSEGVEGPIWGAIRHAAGEGQVMDDAVLALAEDST